MQSILYTYQSETNIGRFYLFTNNENKMKTST